MLVQHPCDPSFINEGSSDKTEVKFGSLRFRLLTGNDLCDHCHFWELWDHMITTMEWYTGTRLFSMDLIPRKNTHLIWVMLTPSAVLGVYIQ